LLAHVEWQHNQGYREKHSRDHQCERLLLPQLQLGYRLYPQKNPQLRAKFH